MMLGQTAARAWLGSVPLPLQQRYDGGDWWHPMWGMWGMWGVWGLVMMLVVLVFWGLVVAGLILGLRWLIQQGRPSRSDPALDILRQRYARGEIDREEFAKRRDLGG